MKITRVEPILVRTPLKLDDAQPHAGGLPKNDVHTVLVKVETDEGLRVTFRCDTASFIARRWVSVPCSSVAPALPVEPHSAPRKGYTGYSFQKGFQ